MATKHRTVQEPPVELPVGFNAWLLDCAPVAGCKVCSDQLEAAQHREEQAATSRKAAKHATEIRDHASGVH
jgi:hypothetical protein